MTLAGALSYVAVFFFGMAFQKSVLGRQNRRYGRDGGDDES